MKGIMITLKITGILIGVLWQVGAYAQTEEDTIITMMDTVSVSPPVEDEYAIAETTEVSNPYPRDTVIFRQVPDSVVMELRRDKDFEYANDPAYWVKEKKKEEEEEPSWFSRLLSQKWFEVLLIVLMAGVLLFAIVKIAMSNNLFLTGGAKKYDTEEERALSEEDNLDELIASAEQQGKFRLAVRYRYRKILKDMDARQLIKLDAKKTNWDYVNAMSGHPLKKKFLLLTRAYEYVWYGEFDINGEQYEYVKTEFMEFKNSI
jgi:hypothetical protein